MTEIDLLSYLRRDLPGLMKRREKVALRAVRDAIAAIENAETGGLHLAASAPTANEHVAGTVAFGSGDRVVQELTAAEMMSLARAQVSTRLEVAARLRASGRINEALTLKAEALALTDRLDAFTDRSRRRR